MATKQESVTLKVEQPAMDSDALLACCLCGMLLQDPVQLTCLHNCCQHCFTKVLSSNSSGKVECSTCGASTRKGSEQPNSFMAHQVQRHTTIAESRICGVCKENGDSDKPALVWCQACGHSLCRECIPGHRYYNRKHVTRSVEEVESLEEVCPPSAATVCPMHKKSLEIVCLNCEQMKCLRCWADCNRSKHKMHIAGEDSFDDYVRKIVGVITSFEEDLRRKLQTIKKPDSILSDLRASRAHHLEQIAQRKRCIVDAVEKAYCEIECTIKNIYENLEKEAGNVSACAGRITTNFLDADVYIRRLVESSSKCDILNQQKVVRQRLQVLSDELDTISDTLTTMGAVNTDPPLPENLENVVKDWIAIPLTQSASSLPRSQHFFFGAAAASMPWEIDCNDVALTKDGHLLLAVSWYGLVELSSTSGRELSSWRAPRVRRHGGGCDTSDDDDMLDDSFPVYSDSVEAVAALSDGRVAAGLHDAMLVVLLKRNGQSGGLGTATAAVAGDTWIVDLRLDRLQWTPERLSAAGGDVLMVSKRHDSRLQLMSLSSGRRLGAEQHRNYTIDSLTVTAHAVVTAGLYRESDMSYGAVYVLDAHSLSDSHEQLWRRKLNKGGIGDVGSDDDDDSDLDDGEYYVARMCTDSTGSVLYAAVGDQHECCEHSLLVINMKDGGELRRVSALSVHSSELLPVRLRLYGTDTIIENPQRATHWEQDCSVLSALCYYPTARACWTVTVHGCTRR